MARYLPFIDSMHVLSRTRIQLSVSRVQDLARFSPLFHHFSHLNLSLARVSLTELQCRFLDPGEELTGQFPMLVLSTES